MRGSKIPEAVEAEFRKHYLVTGNVAAAARQVGIPRTSGQELANRAQEDPEFVEARRKMYSRALPEAERMMMHAMQIALDRLEQGPPDINELAESGASKISVQDAGPAYARAIVDGFKVLTGARRLEAEKAGEIAGPREVVISIVGPEEPADAPAQNGGGNDGPAAA